MNDITWRILFCTVIGSLVWLAHKVIGKYPNPLPVSQRPKRDILTAIILWIVAIGIAALTVFVVTPFLVKNVKNPFIGSLLKAGWLSIPYLLIPLFFVIRPRRWSMTELGLTWKSQSSDVVIFAVVVGLASGCIAYFTGQSNLGIGELSLVELLVLIYSNSFLEEFFYRGVIQSLLERAAGQTKAIFWGGIMYGLVHLALDASVLLEKEGILAFTFAVMMQILAGWMFGIIYMKTRSLLPGMMCHYLGNWLPSLLLSLL